MGFVLRREPWERFKFSLEVWIVQRDRFSAADWELTDGTIFAIHHGLSAPVQHEA